ncbi:putative spermidine/putrescine transport system permease protein/spermidine/putrescine transport system permease protein [Halarchaeum rubridurum]|uniref:ABC transporter permease n=1 Tax=Halarchaeum rubridurum TaxID=489911 RepID=A0A830FZ01_9EURY|nr:ABC transporter permease [Halarchaeum rubridurum]MBP1953426.1 putative spermidine/putrescine transport system permease protein/spermidine/putrescine transport system permease protein [Halarchaeum rubridurum]GGM65346.1 ABC transporter permease [Halarchaeum rubridurum]
MSEVELTRERVEDALFRAGYWLLFAVIMLPIVVVFVTSFQRGEYLTFPPQEFSLRWYAQFFASAEWLSAVRDSIVIGVGASVLSTALGVTGSLAVQRSDSTLARVLPPVILLPLLLPPVVIGLTLLIYFNRVGFGNTYLTIVVAHTLWATPLVFFVMQSVFARFDWDLRDAGMDLGARPSRVFYHVVLPNVRSGVVISAVVAFIVSLQEFIMALFLKSYEVQTVPVLAWTSLQSSLTPLVSVVSAFLVAVSVLGVLVSAALMNIEWLAEQL